jgi:hypothetical protein
MKQSLRFLFLTLGLLVLVAFVLFVFNQITQVYLFTKAIHPSLGLAVLWTLVLLFTCLFLVPVVLYMRLPKPILPPASPEEQPAYLRKLGKRLSKNKRLTTETLNWESEADLQKALHLLDTQADALINATAKSVFLTTSISQNGKLDALTVFITQTKMVWDVAHVYYQRPTLRDMISLYANVGAATFLATQIEDLDISEQFEPVIGTVLQNSALKSIPFVGSVSSVVMDSLLEGTVNAYLTLRVGIITKRYCGALHGFDPRVARKAAYREAAGMLRLLVLQTSGQVVSAIVKAGKKAGVDTVKSGMEVAGRATQSVRTGFGSLFRSRSKEVTGNTES